MISFMSTTYLALCFVNIVLAFIMLNYDVGTAIINMVSAFMCYLAYYYEEPKDE